jgi:hypothetical protein
MFLSAKCTLTLLAMLVVGSATAQVFKVQGGSSTMLDAEGGSVEFKAPNYEGSLGLGVLDGHFEYGAESRRMFHGYTLLAGDDLVPFLLPTDVFDSSHYFSARGIGITRKDSDTRMFAFAGTTSTWMGTGFFNAATSDNPVGIFFYERQLTDRLKLFSRDIVSDRQTSLQGLEWKQNQWLKAALAGGTGSNQKYFASSVDAETHNFALKTSYVLMGDAFERVTVVSPLSSEVNKGNIQFLYKPNHFLSITAGHENILEPLTLAGPMQQASVNQVSGDVHADRVFFGAGLFTSNALGTTTQGTNIYVGSRITPYLEVNTNYFRSVPTSGTAAGQPGEGTDILSGTIREKFTSRFSLLQLISRTEGQTTFSLGGDFTSNRFMVRADYENVYLPFRPTQPFEQALALNAAIRVSGPWQIIAASNVDPTGHLRYSFGLSTYLYRVSGMFVTLPSDQFSIGKYLVQGMVKDEHGLPVEGVALHIGKQVAYSDSAGHFVVRFSKRGQFAVNVVPDEFMTNALYEVVSAPARAKAEVEEAANDLQVVLRRVPPQQTAKQ